jgi:hypothetical protein
LDAGEPQYDAFEKVLATAPAISVPTVTLEGDANGAPHPEPSSYASKFIGKYSHRSLAGGIGHNLPQGSAKAVRRSRGCHGAQYLEVSASVLVMATMGWKRSLAPNGVGHIGRCGPSVYGSVRPKADIQAQRADFGLP